MTTTPQTQGRVKLSPIEQARAYVAQIPGAVQGANGSTQTFKVACCAWNGFNLSEADTLAILEEYNQRCDPAWSLAELKHKVSEAVKAKHGKARGHLLAVADDTNRIQRTLESFHTGTKDQFNRLAKLRGIGREGLEWASQRGVLVFGTWQGHECFGVKDRSGKVLELRKMDGKPFPAYGNLQERKSHAIKGTEKNWPLGILESRNYPCIALVEGVPDFLAAHYECLWEQSPTLCCAPVAMLSASPEIATEALQYFRGKIVRIFPHAEGAGVAGARKWQRQIAFAGAKSCDLFDTTQLRKVTNGTCKDLNDFLKVAMVPSIFTTYPSLERILPNDRS